MPNNWFAFTVISEGLFSPEDGIKADPAGNTNCFHSTQEAYIPTSEAAASELSNPDSTKMTFATQAAFKIPSLRNIELTGPYMHNGSMATLDEVLEFYIRGANFKSNLTHSFVRAFTPEAGVDPIESLALAIQTRNDLVAFLKSLTDERVRYERAPFDHPALK